MRTRSHEKYVMERYFCQHDDCLAHTKAQTVHLLDEAVWDHLKRELEPGRVRAGLVALRERRNQDSGVEHERIQSIQDMLAVEERRIKRLVARSATVEAEVDENDPESIEAAQVTIDTLQADIKQSSKLIVGYRRQVRELSEALNNIELTPEREADILAMAVAAYRRVNGDPSFEQKRALFEALEVKVKIDLISETRPVEIAWNLGVGMGFDLWDKVLDERENGQNGGNIGDHSRTQRLHGI